MMELLISLVMRLIGVRIVNQIMEEAQGGLDRAGARSGAPDRDALIRAHHQVVGTLVGGAFPPATAATPQLVSPQAPAPAAGQGVAVPLPQPAPAPGRPVPAALPAKRRGRPPKHRPVEGPSVHPNGHVSEGFSA
jgi:hypothetical protein